MKEQLDDVNSQSELVEYDQKLLWLHQEPWQQELLVKYGDTITLMDATYKTTQDEVLLFFISVRTNVGYSVVAEFIIHHEQAEEALQVLKEWNPLWSPAFFMTDYSEAEMLAVKKGFPIYHPLPMRLPQRTVVGTMGQKSQQ